MVITAGCLVTLAGGNPTPAWARGRGGYRPAPQTDKVVAIRAGRLFDSKAGRMPANQAILITGDKITDVGPNLSIPAGATTIDLSRATVLPGMVDGHLHLSGPIRLTIPVTNNGAGDPNPGPQDGLMAYIQQANKDLHAGVTTVRELGGTWDGVVHKDAVNNGVSVGPRTLVAGPNFAVGGTSGVNSPETARAAVREWKMKGADVIKLHTDGGGLRPADRHVESGWHDDVGAESKQAASCSISILPSRSTMSVFSGGRLSTSPVLLSSAPKTSPNKTLHQFLNRLHSSCSAPASSQELVTGASGGRRHSEHRRMFTRAALRWACPCSYDVTASQERPRRRECLGPLIADLARTHRHPSPG